MTVLLAIDYKRIRERFDQASLPDGEEYVQSYNIGYDSTYIIKSELTFNPDALNMPTSMQNFYQDKIPTRAIRKFKFGLMGVENNKIFYSK